jgi:hypothetical protein
MPAMRSALSTAVDQSLEPAAFCQNNWAARGIRRREFCPVENKQEQRLYAIPNATYPNEDTTPNFLFLAVRHAQQHRSILDSKLPRKSREGHWRG